MKKINSIEAVSVFILRVMLGWHLMYEGIVKLLDPGWTSLQFLLQSKGIMSGFYQWIAQNENVLKMADQLNIWGLIFIGAGLILGLFTRISAWSGALLLLLYYFSNPPLIGVDPSPFQEGSYLIVNKTLIEAMTLIVIGLMPAARNYAIDLLIKKDNNGQ